MLPCFSPAPKRQLVSFLSFSKSDGTRRIIGRQLLRQVFELLMVKVAIFMLLWQSFLRNFVCRTVWFIVTFDTAAKFCLDFTSLFRVYISKLWSRTCSWRFLAASWHFEMSVQNSWKPRVKQTVILIVPYMIECFVPDLAEQYSQISSLQGQSIGKKVLKMLLLGYVKGGRINLLPSCIGLFDSDLMSKKKCIYFRPCPSLFFVVS